MGEKELKQREGNSPVPNQKYFMFLLKEFFPSRRIFPSRVIHMQLSFPKLNSGLAGKV